MKTMGEIMERAELMLIAMNHIGFHYIDKSSNYKKFINSMKLFEYSKIIQEGYNKL
jgi:hypothetical protein